MKKLLFFVLISSFALMYSCKKDEKVCLRCVGETTVCEGEKDDEGNTITKEDLQLAKAFLEAFDAECTLD